jgi:hypothetical protein
MPWESALWQAAYEMRESGRLPGHVVVSPTGRVVHAGRLSLDDVPRLVSSPARQRIARELCQRRLGVMVLLEGESVEETDATERIARQAIGGAIAGMDAPVGFERLARDSAEEAVLIQSLLSVEPDLPEIDAPMLFTFYGRARALPPLIGKGISDANVKQAVAFLTSDCSCLIKDDRPGVAMLMEYDWQSQLVDAPAPETAPALTPTLPAGPTGFEKSMVRPLLLAASGLLMLATVMAAALFLRRRARFF